jgi:thioesterase domain-containing protein
VPSGLPGEICIGGAGLALGYLGDAALTAARFVPHPFRAGARLYRSGDVGRQDAGGAITFVGRVDTQVKLRGFRIELSEIEAELGRHPAVGECHVAVRGAGEARRLVAYYVPRATVTEPQLRAHLRARLPEYMVPGALVALAALPLNANGKVEAAALPEPGEVLSADAAVPPATETERCLLEVWEEVLERRGFGVEADFFDLGGHSLLALRMAVEAERRCGHAFPVGLLFRAPTVRQLAAELEGPPTDGRAEPSTLVPMQPEGTRPPVFFVHAGDGGVLFYRALSRLLGRDQPSYGLEAPWLTGREAGQQTIEEIASFYISETLKVHPRGPFHLGGFSFGGVVAYEMARQLRARGETVGLLCLFDTYNPQRPPRRLAVSERLDQHRAATARMHPVAALAHLGRRAWAKLCVQGLVARERLGQWTGRVLVATGFRLPAGLRTMRARDTHLAALETYHPQAYDGGMLLFTAQTRNDGYAYESDLGWGDLVPGGPRTVSVPGSHDTILLGPNVQAVAVALRAELDRLAGA